MLNFVNYSLKRLKLVFWNDHPSQLILIPYKIAAEAEEPRQLVI